MIHTGILKWKLYLYIHYIKTCMDNVNFNHYFFCGMNVMTLPSYATKMYAKRNICNFCYFYTKSWIYFSYSFSFIYCNSSLLPSAFCYLYLSVKQFYLITK
jgi:hypothetical protein